MSTSFSTSRLVSRLRVPSLPQAVQLSLFVLVVYAVSLVPVDAPGVSLIRNVAGFTLLTFVPGYLVLSYVRSELRYVDLLYAVGLSVALVMLVGWASNALYLQLSVWFEPFDEVNTPLFYLGVVGTLTGAVWYLSDRTSGSLPPMPSYDYRALTALVSVPMLAVAGAHIINKAGFNGVSLLAILLNAAVLVAVYYFDDKGRYYSIAVLMVSVSLVLQNTVIITYLGRGDALIEYSIGKQVLENGFWLPGGGKAGMPRIGVLHPVYSLVMDLNLFWEYKLIHPLLFALGPVITYKLTERYFSTDIAFLSAVLYIFLPRTYQLLGRNTRTGSAILFTGFLLLVILDSDLRESYQSAIAMLFFWAVISSHYGIGPLVLFALFVAYALNLFSAVVLKNKRPSELPLGRVGLYGAITTVWYLYQTSGTFDFISGVIIGSFTGQVFFTSSSTATRSLSFQMPSLSYQVMLSGHVLVGVLSSLGIGFVLLRYFGHGLSRVDRLRSWIARNVFPQLPDRVLEDPNYVHLAFGVYLIFPLSFGPQILSAGRTFGLVMLILAPFPILVLRSTRFPTVGAKPAIASLVVLLLITSGFLSATVTHDVSPQPEIDGERIVESGSTIEQFSYYRISSSKSNVFASNFILAHFSDDSNVYKTELGKFIQQLYTGERRANVGFSQLEGSDGYQRFIYLSEPDTVTGTNTEGYLGFTYYQYTPLSSYDQSSQIYTTGPDQIYYNHR